MSLPPKTLLFAVALFVVVNGLSQIRLHAQAATSPAPNSVPHPIEDTPKLDFIYEEVVTLGAAVHPGETPWGERNIVPITGGTFSGPDIKGKILPGGWDWQLASKSGCHQIKADYMIQTDDGVIINVLNRGTYCTGKGEKAARLLTEPVFEAPLGKYDWLNEGAYVGTLQGATVDGKPAVRIRFYKAR